MVFFIIVGSADICMFTYGFGLHCKPKITVMLKLKWLSYFMISAIKDKRRKGKTIREHQLNIMLCSRASYLYNFWLICVYINFLGCSFNQINFHPVFNKFQQTSNLYRTAFIIKSQLRPSQSNCTRSCIKLSLCEIYKLISKHYKYVIAMWFIFQSNNSQN